VEALLSEDNPIQQAKDITDFKLGKEDDFANLNIFFGVEPELRETLEHKSFWDKSLTG